MMICKVQLVLICESVGCQGHSIPMMNCLYLLLLKEISSAFV